MTFAYARRRQSPRHTGHWSPSLGASNIQHSDVQGQRAQPAKGSTAKTTTRADVVENARRTAFARTVSSRLKTVGVTAPGPSGGIDSSQVAQLESRFVAQRMFDWEQPNMGQVGDILGTMITHLSPGMKWEASAQDKVCKERKFTAYVVGHRPPIHLCPRFFTSGPEQQIRTLVHESAHLAGIGQSEGESYCVTFDCQGGCGGFEAADSWSHYVHCTSQQRPDKADTYTAPRRKP